MLQCSSWHTACLPRCWAVNQQLLTLLCMCSQGLRQQHPRLQTRLRRLSQRRVLTLPSQQPRQQRSALHAQLQCQGFVVG